MVIFITGSDLGSLKPCGCSGGQLGGLEKRPAIFNRVPASRRLLVDTGGFLENDDEQDLIKFHVFFEALGLLNYDAVRLTERDVEIAERLGLLVGVEHGFDILKDRGDGPAVFSRQFPDLGVTVNVASFNPRTSAPQQVATLFEKGGQAVNILILEDCDSDSLSDILANASGIDCIVCPPGSDEPLLLSDPGDRPLVVTPGRFGRYVCRLRVAVPEQGEPPALEFDWIPVVEQLPDDGNLVRLYRQYQQLVGESGLLESYPRVPLPDGLTFVGSRACQRCHEYEYEQWNTKAHADALASLKRVGSDRDPECVLCHVVGMEYESGFITEEKTPHLKDVGCETCHGPGSEHIQSFGRKATRQPQMSCVACHTPEKSTGFAGNEEQYMQKIVHWREPTAAGNVKD